METLKHQVVELGKEDQGRNVKHGEASRVVRGNGKEALRDSERVGRRIWGIG
ncbi:uncharacterized protein G2W53_020654 [Senna tora]|uniref:Uncharacterized protein n=1 Tax=Senna tora TaxID=362788 RepID=A0A834TIQ7_9FABA|nr:uncharacterized protein G2W53_020654 [Senna tora]